MKEAGILGIMSGTSLDGLDIAHCRFTKTNNGWEFSIKEAEVFNYSEYWQNRFLQAPSLGGRDLMLLEIEFSQYVVQCIHTFCKKHNVKPILIAAHGHTIFHEPSIGLTYQMLDGGLVAELTEIPVVCNFRKGDVALGGQGAPLVPLGDELLFKDFSYCLNLGGIANITIDENGIRRGFDIVPANMALNDSIRKIGKNYDSEGEMARSGKVHSELLHALNSLEFYSLPHPKSLGREFYENEFKHVIRRWSLPVEDELCTLAEHTALQIGNILKGATPDKKLLATGGGAFNTYLMERIRFHTSCDVVVPDEKIVSFKESLIFAFLGLLRANKEKNISGSITGAGRDSSGGGMFIPLL